MKKILFIFGTRPETIKMAPVIKEFQRFPRLFQVKICVTAQHREMLDQFLTFFNIKPDYDLNIMIHDQSLSYITSIILLKIEKVLDEYNPDLIIIQGDTTTTFVAALAAYYKKIKVAHVEAGLRTNDKYFPYPEEINRVLTSRLVDYYFAPTEKAKINLLNEGIKDNVWVVGNSVIDALLLSLKKIKKEKQNNYFEYFKHINFSKKIILVTSHRRESFGEPLKNICFALKKISKEFENIVEIVYPVHLNPNVKVKVNKILKNINNVHLLSPLGYQFFIWLLNKSFLVITDSGGVQEEAPSLGKPILVIRDITERLEGIEAGTAKLVGTNEENIVKEIKKLITDKKEYKKMANAVNPYGDGKTSKKIFNIIKKLYF